MLQRIPKLIESAYVLYHRILRAFFIRARLQSDQIVDQCANRLGSLRDMPVGHMPHPFAKQRLLATTPQCRQIRHGSWPLRRGITVDYLAYANLAHASPIPMTPTKVGRTEIARRMRFGRFSILRRFPLR
jgi:hypothetical protein